MSHFTRLCIEYVNGVEHFFECVFDHVEDEDMKINCLCFDHVRILYLFINRGITYTYTFGITVGRR